MAISNIRLVENAGVFHLEALITNRGNTDASGPFTVNFYDGDPNNGGQLIANTTVANISAGDAISAVSTAITVLPSAEIVTGVVETTGFDDAVAENNRAVSLPVAVEVSDIG